MVEDDLLVLFRLVKAGYGSLNEVSSMTAREVIQALHYEKFMTDFESAYIEANK